jgi:hypothetical protein
MAALGILILATLYYFTRPTLDWSYGMTSISVNGQPLYVKYHDCGAVCSGQMYLTQNPKRCAREDPNHDYLASNSDDTLNFAVRDNHLIIAGDHWSIPPDPWLPTKFIPTYGHDSDQYRTTFIMFGDHLDEISPTGLHVEMRPCRVFPDGLFDGTWREWVR